MHISLSQSPERTKWEERSPASANTNSRPRRVDRRPVLKYPCTRRAPICGLVQTGISLCLILSIEAGLMTKDQSSDAPVFSSTSVSECRFEMPEVLCFIFFQLPAQSSVAPLRPALPEAHPQDRENRSRTIPFVISYNVAQVTWHKHPLRH